MNDETWEQQTAARVYEAIVSGEHRQQITSAAHRQARRYATGGALAIVTLAGIGLTYTLRQPADHSPPGDTPAVTAPTPSTLSQQACPGEADDLSTGAAGPPCAADRSSTTDPISTPQSRTSSTADGCIDAAGSDGRPIAPNHSANCGRPDDELE